MFLDRPFDKFDIDKRNEADITTQLFFMFNKPDI